jgi:type II secretory pathway component PulK
MNKIHRKPRSGALLICVLVCLLVASAMVTATTRSALQSRRDVRLQHQMRQTELLLDAGILRAVSQLQRSNDYQGETWRPKNALARFDNPSLEIRVSVGEKNKNDSRRIEVIASLGAADNLKQFNASLTRRTHTFFIELSEVSPTPQSSTAE